MKRFLGVSLMVAAIALVAAPKAEAALAVTMLVCQTGPGCMTPVDLAPSATGFLATSFAWGDYQVNGVAGNAVEGSLLSTGNELGASVQRIGSANPGAPLEIYLIATGYVLPSGTALNLDSSTGGSANGLLGSWTYQAWFSNSNSSAIPPVGPSNGVVPCPLSGGVPSSCSGNGSSLAVVGGTPAFSLIGRITVSIPVSELVAPTSPSNAYNPNGTITVTAVPEPGTMVLLGTGLLGLAAAVRRRTAKA